ncbi:hypothetical protein JB92DRAFT_1401920 [Gautieria morchelliformis]|nr:hypothetical protein JB92DRAFT_1401920 [Gautieria morchelliformis]
MVSEGASFSSASIQMTSNNTKAKSSSPQRSTKPKPKLKLVIFHNPASLTSARLLAFLQSAQRAYPETKRRVGPPLDFELTVRERLPTAQELQDMYSLLNESSWTVFRAKNAAGNYRIHPTSARSLLSGIELERQEQIAKAKQKTHDSAVASEPPPADSPDSAVACDPPAMDSPDSAAACDPPATDSPQTEPKNNKCCFARKRTKFSLVRG